MSFNIDGTVLHWLDGTSGIAHQKKDFELERDPDRHAYAADLSIEREGAPTCNGNLRYLEVIQGEIGLDDAERRSAIALALINWVKGNGLNNGFKLQVF